MIREVLAEGVELWCCDWHEANPKIPLVDVTITDPPYAEKTHKGARGSGSGKKKLVTFDSIDDDGFVRLCRTLCARTKRWVVMTCDFTHCALAQVQMPNEFIRAGVWVKPNGMPQYTGDRPSMGFESVAILHRQGRKKWNGGGSHAVWTVPKVSSDDHETQKPIPLIREWVSLFSDVGETVFDPYMGSGTTGVAAINAGRGFIGVEAHRPYYEIAKARIMATLAQADLFISKPEPKPTQEKMVL